MAMPSRRQEEESKTLSSLPPSTSTSTFQRIRNRDLIAALSVLLLYAVTHSHHRHQQNSSWKVSSSLSMYTEFTSHIEIRKNVLLNNEKNNENTRKNRKEVRVVTNVAKPVLMDVDGDGIAEALVCAVPQSRSKDGIDTPIDSEKEWTIAILDLAPLHKKQQHKKKKQKHKKKQPMNQNPFQTHNPNNGPSILQHANGINGGPLYPSVLFQTSTPQQQPEEQTQQDKEQIIIPIFLTTTQLHPHGYALQVEESSESSSSSSYSSSSPSSKYYCGLSWNDASTDCSTPCPSGDAKSCPPGESCFADVDCSRTSSSYTSRYTSTSTPIDWALTPRKSVPSVISIWNNGMIYCHGITANVTANESQLNVHELWAASLVRNDNEEEENEEQDGVWEELDHDQVNVIMEHSSTFTMFGLMIVTVSYTTSKTTMTSATRPPISSTLYIALNPWTGERVWTHSTRSSSTDTILDKFHQEDDSRQEGGDHTSMASTSEETNNVNNIPKPVSSSARRKSHRFGIQNPMNTSSSSTATTPDCFHSFPSWMMNPMIPALPHYSHWDSISDFVTEDSNEDENDSSWDDGLKPQQESPTLFLTHLDRKHVIQKDIHEATNTKRVLPRKKQSMKNYHRQQRRQQQQLKTNVVLVHNQFGITALSLRNGRPVCHSSLLTKRLYADINGDGILDDFQIILDQAGTHHNLDEDKMKTMTTSTNPKEKNDLYESSQDYATKLVNQVREDPRTTRLCHALLLSGVPAREELFRASVCNFKSYTDIPLSVAPPLLVDGSTSSTADMNSLSASQPRDIVIALSDGTITRLDENGRRVWTSLGREGTPTWHHENGHGRDGFLGFIDVRYKSKMVSSSSKPIIISGSDGFAIISQSTGRVLDHKQFPQMAMGRTILTDINGDGTTDIIVTSADAIWGYCIQVDRSGLSFMEVMMYLLLLGIGVAWLYQLTDKDAKRATDYVT